MIRLILFVFASLVLIRPLAAQEGAPAFRNDLQTSRLPWTDRPFHNDPSQFQFAIVTDRTGGHRAGIFGKAMEKLNLLHPEFVMSVGDLIEGYTENQQEIDAQWAEFDSILAQLQMRFFALPGNHDISNQVMRDAWLERYGRSYYHFRYGDVLFLAFDSNDGDGVAFSREQLDYFKKAIAENDDVRWTMLFMHHPVWRYREFNGFDEIENALADRPYTVVAGHVHRYMKSMRRNRNYYTLATTGGGSRLRGPRLGEFDHVTWVTMTESGPELINLELGGMLADDVLSEENLPLAQALMQAAEMQCQLLEVDDKAGLAYLNVENQADKPLFFNGRFYHNHHIDPGVGKVELEIAPRSRSQVVIPLTKDPGRSRTDIEPLELAWTAAFDSPALEPAFALSGVYELPLDAAVKDLRFTEMSVFLADHEVTLAHDYQDVQVRYTLDGREPTLASSVYEGPFQLLQTTTVKARLFDATGKARSAVIEKTYRKVEPYAPVDPGKTIPGLAYTYYEGAFKKLPDFEKLEPVKKGVTQDFDVEHLAAVEDHFAFVFEGWVEVPADGVYTFYTYSDDGSKLYLHDELVVDNDGSHSARLRSGNVALRKGRHPLRLEYFEDYLGESLRIGYEGPDGERRELAPGEMFCRR